MGCNAKIVIKLNKSNGKYWVSHFMDNHNHPLVRQECTQMLLPHRRISASQATEHGSRAAILELLALVSQPRHRYGGSFFDDPDPDHDYDDDDDLDSDSDSDNDLDPHSDDDSDPDPKFVFDSDPDPDFDSDSDPVSGLDPDPNSY
ncbi:unnamed protein product [Prunus armeniaca]